MSKKFLTAREVAERWAVGHHTVLEWIRRGRLPATRLVGTYRIRPEDVEAMEAAGDCARVAPKGESA